MICKFPNSKRQTQQDIKLLLCDWTVVYIISTQRPKHHPDYLRALLWLVVVHTVSRIEQNCPQKEMQLIALMDATHMFWVCLKAQGCDWEAVWHLLYCLSLPRRCTLRSRTMKITVFMLGGYFYMWFISFQLILSSQTLSSFPSCS